MNIQQLYAVHSSKGYTLDLLFASPNTCEYSSVDEVLVVGDPDHHESAFFKVTARESVSEWHDSKNKTSKNYYRANFGLINTCWMWTGMPFLVIVILSLRFQQGFCSQ